MKVLIRRRVVSVIMALMMVVTLVPLSATDAKADVTFYFSKQPQSGEVAGSEKLTVRWDNNFNPDRIEIWRDKSSDGLEDYRYVNTYYSDDFEKYDLPSSDYPYYIKAYHTYTINNKSYTVSCTSGKFYVRQIGAFDLQPKDGEVTGSNKYKATYKTNFTPSRIEIWRNRSKDELEDYRYVNSYYSDDFESYDLPSCDYPYYVVAHYTVDGVDKSVTSDEFYVRQVGAFTKQPAASQVAGSEKFLAEWKLNYVPGRIEIWRNRSKDELEDYRYVNTYYSDDFEKYELPSSKYPYYIRAHYIVDGVDYYFQSEDFLIEQTAVFTEQPQGGSVEGSEKLDVSWNTNFNIERIEIWRNQSKDELEDYRYVNTYYSEDFNNYKLPYSEYPYYIYAYYSVDGVSYRVKSDEFTISNGAGFTLQPVDCEVTGGEKYTVRYKTSFAPGRIEVWRDKSSDNLEDYRDINSYYESDFESVDLKASKYPYYIIAYYSVDGVQKSVTSDKFYVKQMADFDFQPGDFDVTGGEEATVNYSVNFSPDRIEIWRDKSIDEQSDYRDVNSYYSDDYERYKLKASKYPYYIRMYYTDNDGTNFVESKKFYVNQTAAFENEPQSCKVAGNEKYLVTYLPNFKPDRIEIWRNRSKDELEDYRYVNTYYSDDFEKYELPSSKYPYYIRAHYSDNDGAHYVQSNNFYVEQTACFIQQPYDGAVIGNEKFEATWEANFVTERIEIWQDKTSVGEADNRIVNSSYKIDFESYNLSSSDYPYYVKLFYTMDGAAQTVESERFNITRGEAFLVKPKDVEVIDADATTINWSTNFKPDKFEIWSDYSGIKTEDDVQKEDVKLATLDKPEKEVEYTFATSDIPYYILAYYKDNGNEATIRSNSFKVTKHVHELEPVKEVAATCTSKGRKAYYKCKTCGNCYENEDATVKIDDLTKLDTDIIDHTYKTDITKAKYGSNGKIVKYCSQCKGKETTTTTVIQYPKTIELNAKSFVYTGKQITPKVVNVKDIKGVVIPASNYTVSYSDNINVGKKATVKITFKSTSSKYTGSMSTTFEITQAGNSITATAAYTKTAQAKAQTFKLNAKAKSGKVTYKSNNSNVKVDSTGKVTITKNYSGVATITLTAGNRNYKSVTKKITITVIPATTSIKSIVNNVAKKAKVIWNKLTYTSGYQLQYSTNSSFASGNKTVNVKGGASYNTLVSNLVKGKTYYFRIRTYKVISGKNVFSTWSGKKSVKITK